MRGTSSAVGSLRGAPIISHNRDLFIYRVQKDVETNELKEFIVEKVINIQGLVCVSHNDAMFKSFKLTVLKNQISQLFDAAIWPEGICIRKFRSSHAD